MLGSSRFVRGAILLSVLSVGCVAPRALRHLPQVRTRVGARHLHHQPLDLVGQRMPLVQQRGVGLPRSHLPEQSLRNPQLVAEHPRAEGRQLMVRFCFGSSTGA